MEVKPLIGLGDIRLGSIPSEVNICMGEPIAISKMDEKRNWLRFIYKNSIFCNVIDNLVYSICAGRRAKNIIYKNLDVFASDPFEVLRVFERDAGHAFEGTGSVVFPSIGIGTTGFHDNDLDEKTIGIGRADEWDSIKYRLKPISFLKG